MNKYLKYTLLGLLWAAVLVYLLLAGGRVRRHRADQVVERIEVEVEDSTLQRRLVSGATVKRWIASSGIKTIGQKIGQVNLGAIERLIADNGFVADAHASVTYSGTLDIRVSQRTPLMRLLLDGYNSYVTEEGYVFATPRNSAVYVPVVTGSYRPLFPPSYTGSAEAFMQEQLRKSEERIASLEREKYPLYQREIQNDENTRAVRRMFIKKGWFESSEEFSERVKALRKHKEQLRRKYRYEAQVIQSAIDKITNRQEAELATQKKIVKRHEDFLKLANFVKWIEDDDFWRSEIVQIVARTTDSGALEVDLIPRSGAYTIRFGRLEEVEPKFDKLLKFYRKGLSRFGWDRYKTIDVRFEGQVVCS